MGRIFHLEEFFREITNMPARHYTIRHDIPGRIRIGMHRLRQPEAARAVREAFANRKGVLLVRVNPRCASMVLGYDPLLIPRDELLRLVRDLAGKDSSAVPGDTARKGAGQSVAPCPCSRKKRGPVGSALMRFVALSAVLGVVVARKTLLGRPTLQTPLSPLGLTALAFTVPLLRTCLKRSPGGTTTLEGFLAAGSVTATVTGEALTALEILWINAGGELLTAWIAERSRKSIASILQLTDHHTFILVDGVEVERNVDELRPGDVVVLHSGEKICVDGEVVSGQALVDEAPITGRVEPEYREAGRQVFAGSFVRQGILRVRAESVGDRTYLARVMHKVEHALENRAPIEGVADRLASTLVRLGLGATALTWLATADAWRALTVLLVMACPCATVLAASTGVSAAISAAARRRILIKGGRYLEEVGKCDMVFFDKTGTLTTTRPELSKIVTMPGISEADLLRLSSSAETHNHHPLAHAILAEAALRDLTPLDHALCEYHMGMGMRVLVENREILVGNAKLARLYAADIDPLTAEASRMGTHGLTVLFVCQDRRPLGLLGFAAQVRPEAVEVLRSLRGMGVRRFALITGDEQASAEHLARSLGIEECHASVMPEDKADFVLAAKSRGMRTLMVGDGINDALALTHADVGVALGGAGSEVAIEAADIALVADDLRALSDVYALSRRTLRVVRQNFWIATGSNLAGVLFGALGVLTPVTAGLAHIGHSLGVLANSSRLLREPEREKHNHTRRPQ